MHINVKTNIGLLINMVESGTSRIRDTECWRDVFKTPGALWWTFRDKSEWIQCISCSYAVRIIILCVPTL